MTSEIVAFNEYAYRPGDLCRVVAPPFNDEASSVQVSVGGNDVTEYIGVGCVVLLVDIFVSHSYHGGVCRADIMFKNNIYEIDMMLLEKIGRTDDAA
jgi:hypothetical protein